MRTTPESLADLVALVQNAGDPEANLVGHLVARVGETDPILADAIRLCAIPRRLDAEVVGVLRDATDQPGMNERILERLARHPFALRRDDGSLVYHDDTRDALLREWQSDAQRKERFHEANRRLALHHLEKRRQAQSLERDLESVAPILEEADPERHAQIVSAIEARMSAALHEALYHATLMSLRTGFDVFESVVEPYGRTGHPLARSLLSAIERYVSELPYPVEEAADGAWRRWLDYYRLQVDRAAGQAGPATEQGFLKLLEEAGDDTRLQVWILDDLTTTAVADSRIADAIAFGKRAVAIAESADAEPLGLAVSYLRLGRLSFAKHRYEDAVPALRRVIEIARQLDRPHFEVEAQSRLADIANTTGDTDAAWGALFEALTVARTRAPESQESNRRITELAMELVGQGEPGLLDALFAEAVGYDGDRTARWNLEVTYATTLVDSGRLTEADVVIRELDERGPEGPGAPRAQLVNARCSLLRTWGRMDEAIAACSAALADPELEAGPLQRFVLLANRIDSFLTTGRFAEAERDARACLALCEEAGFAVALSLSHVMLAKIWLQSGRLDDAQAALDTAGRDIGDSGTQVWAFWSAATAELARRRGRWADARTAYEDALGFYAEQSPNDDVHVAILHDLVLVEQGRGRPAEAAAYADRLTHVLRERAAIDEFRLSDEEKEAARLNASGVAAFCVDVSPRLEAVATARDRFRAAVDLCPDVSWYWLNLSFSCRELGDWDEAARALEAALAAGVPAGGRPVVVRELLWLRLAHARALRNDGRAADAVRLLERTHTDMQAEIAPALLPPVFSEIGDARLATQDWRLAEADYRKALSIAAELPDAAPRPGLHGRLALVVAAGGDVAAASRLLARALDEQPADESGSRAVPLLEDLNPIVTTPVLARGLAESVRTLRRHPDLADDTRRDVASASLLWANAAFRKALRPVNRPAVRGDAEEPELYLARLTLDAAESFFGESWDSHERAQMLEVDLPAMRARITATTGVEVPGVSMRASLPAGREYVLGVDGVPYVRGVADCDSHFAPDASACSAAGFSGRAEHLPDGREGMWLAPADAERAAAAGIETWDVYRLWVRQLEALALRHLDRFIGVDQVAGRLAHIGASHVDPVAVTAVLRALSREGTPIGDLPMIVAAMTPADGRAAASDVLDRVRGALASSSGGDGSAP